MNITPFCCAAMASSLLTACFVLVSNNAQAGPETEEKSNKIETITVLGKAAGETANLGGIALQELPLNAHVVGQAEIDRIRFVDPDELLDRIPGETQVRNLRIPNGGKSYTLAFVDGVPIESPYEGATQRLDRVNTFDIQRVEVIKGPASALYPNNVFGGVVNVVSRDVPEAKVANISAEVGNFGRERLGLSVGSTLGQLGYFLDANSRRLEGLREGAKNDRDAASLKLVYKIGDTTQISSRLERLEETVEVRGDLTALQIAQDPRQAGSLSSATDFEQNTASVALKHHLSSGQISAIALIRQKSSIGQSRFRGPQDSTDDAVNINANYRHKLANGSVIFGVDTYRGDVDTKAYGRRDTELSGPFNEFATKLDIDAYFAQYQFSLSRYLTATAGVRYEDIFLSSSVDDQQAADFSDLAPKLGLNYKLSDTHQLWFSVSEGFYAPELDDLFDADNGNPNLDPEEALNIEFGFRGLFGELAYDSSIYHNQIDNYLVTQELLDTNGDEFELTTNAGKVTVKGVESVIEYAPENARWRVGITHTYADNTYDLFVQSVPGADDDLTGKELRRSPKHHLNARVAWEPISNFTAELEGDFYSSYFSDDANSPQGKFRRDERLNLRLTYHFDDWQFWLNVLNMTDTLEDRATFRRGTLSFRTVDGRSYYSGFSYQF